MFTTSTLALVISITLIAFMKTMVASPPSIVVDWFVKKIDTLHPRLTDDAVTVSLDEKQLEGEEKTSVVNFFNQATFLKKYDVLPVRGTTIPLIIEFKKGNKPVKFYLYIYSDRVNVFKEYKKKVVAYYLSAENLPQESVFQNIHVSA